MPVVELFDNNAITNLSSGITSSQTSFTVLSSALFPAAVSGTSQFRIAIDTELMIVTNVSGTTWTVARGQEGTTAASHSASAGVYGVLTAASVQYALPLWGGTVVPTGDTSDSGFAFTTVPDGAAVPVGVFQFNGGAGYTAGATLDIGAGHSGVSLQAGAEVDIGNGSFSDPSPGSAFDLRCGGPNGGITCQGAINSNSGFLVNNFTAIDASGEFVFATGNIFADSSGNIYSAGGNIVIDPLGRIFTSSGTLVVDQSGNVYLDQQLLTGGSPGSSGQFLKSTGSNVVWSSFAPATVGISRGGFSGTGTATTSFVVTIGTTQANTTYRVSVTPTAALAAAVCYISAKTTTTFTVTYLAGLTGTVTFDWILVP